MLSGESTFDKIKSASLQYIEVFKEDKHADRATDFSRI